MIKRTVLLFLVHQCLVSCGRPSKLVELDHTLGLEIPKYPLPGYFNPVLETAQEGHTKDGYWSVVQKLSSHEHIGTHYDAPILFNPTGDSLNEIPIEKFFGPAVVIDIRKQAERYSNYELTAQDVQDWVKVHGIFPNNSFILINTGWDSRWPSQLKYFGDANDPTKLVYPGTSVKAMEALFEFKDTHNIHIDGVGIDTPSLDNGPDLVNSDAQRYVANQNVGQLVNLKSLHLLPPKGTLLTVMPMLIEEGTAAPMRVWAKIPDTDGDLPKSSTNNTQTPSATSTQTLIRLGKSVFHKESVVENEIPINDISDEEESGSVESGEDEDEDEDELGDGEVEPETETETETEGYSYLIPDWEIDSEGESSESESDEDEDYY